MRVLERLPLFYRLSGVIGTTLFANQTPKWMATWGTRHPRPVEPSFTRTCVERRTPVRWRLGRDFFSLSDAGEFEDGAEVAPVAALGACDRGLHSLELVLFLLS